MTELEPSSLRLKLLNRLLPALLLLLLIGAATAYWTAVRAATKAYDRNLLDIAFAISEQVIFVDDEYLVPLTAQARDVLLTDKFDRISYAVIGPNGGLIDGNPDLPKPVAEVLRQLEDEGRSYYDGELAGEPVRVAAYHKTLGGGCVTVVAAETLIKRNDLVRDTLLGILMPGMLLIAVSASVIWFGVHSGLRPLDSLRSDLANRSPSDLRPVTLAVPEEIQPVAVEINGLLERLQLALESQRNFVSDAAHQLRTPLAALQAQVDLAAHESAAEAPERLAGINKATHRLSHLVEQLLALARAEPDLLRVSERVDIVRLIPPLAEEWLPRAISRDIDLGFELAPVTIAGNALLLHELLVNLLDNALRHTPNGGVITVACGVTMAGAFLSVEDSGPGIPESERVRVFERFYRSLGQGGDGCGLGLAIVREIARQHGGSVEAGKSERLGGAWMRVLLPLSRANMPGTP